MKGGHIMGSRRTKSLNKEVASSLIHKNHPELKAKDIRKTLDYLEDIIEYALDTGQEFKLGETMKLIPEKQKARKQYNGAGQLTGKKTKEYIDLPERVLIKFKPMKRLQKVQRDSWKK